MALPDLIYCADGNARFAKIAIEAGFLYGAQLPNTVYYHPEFTDQDWQQPNRQKYIDAVRQHKPRIATVLDWEYTDDFATVLDWAEEVAAIVETVVIIPKVDNLWMIPATIGGKKIRLGYSVPTRFGKTDVPLKSFGRRGVHLLGGSPLEQLRLAKSLNVLSVDCNYHQAMASRYNQFFVPDSSATYAKNKMWPTLREAANGERYGDGTNKADAPYEAFRRSCHNIMAMWHGWPAESFTTFEQLGFMEPPR